MKKVATTLISIALVLSCVFTATAQVKADIDKANKKGKTVYLVVTDGKEDIEHANKLATEAGKQLSKAEVLTLNKNDKANAELVTKYGVAGASTPIILVVAPNGIVCAGMPANTATVENLVDAVPTVCQAKALGAFGDKKAVFVIVSNKTMKDKTAVLVECKKACSKLGDKAIYMDIDLDDKEEKRFLDLLQVDYKATKTNVIIFNAKGQYAGKLAAPVKAATLEIQSKKQVKSCCPPGSKKKC